MEYMPHIRSICLSDRNNTAAATATRNTRKKRNSRYIKLLDDESRDIINWQQI